VVAYLAFLLAYAPEVAAFYGFYAFRARCSATRHASPPLRPAVRSHLDAKKSSTDDDADTVVINGKKFREGSLMAATARQGRVPYGESSRKYRRTVFSYDDWVEHRSEDRFADNLKSVFFSGIVRQLRKQVAVVTLIATCVVLWNSGVAFYLDGSVPQLSLPPLPFTVSSPALGLLLVFRTNSSYQRWLDARMTWAKIISQSRNMVRMAATFISENEENPNNEAALNELSRAIWAFSRSLMNQVSDPKDDDKYLEELTDAFSKDSDSDGFLPYITSLSKEDRATTALMEVSLVLNAIPVDEKRRVESDKSLVILGDCLATCDRIFTSPVPLVYTRHTARFLSLFLILLPLALYETFDPASASSSVPWWQH